MRPHSLLAAVLLAVAALGPQSAQGQADDLLARGEYVFRASGGCSCHTNVADGGPEMAGGRPLETAFGVFYSTNITPDVETGIGRWSEADFARAMREGRAPDGSAYFPVFPYTSFSGMRDEDLRALRAYLRSLPAVTLENRPHDAPPPLRWRLAARVWQWLFFEPRRIQAEPERSEDWNRGHYLAEALGHCGECHTPRGASGALDDSLYLAGSRDVPDGELAPNITPDGATGIGEWSAADVAWLLQMGFKPDGDDVQGVMRELIDRGYGHLQPSDLRALASYIVSVPAIERQLKPEAD